MSEEIWDEWNRRGGPLYPTSILVQHVFRTFGKDREQHQNVRVLDLGCGNGANTAFFAENGFETYACDASNVAVETTRLLLEQRGLEAEVRRCDAFREPQFDFIACMQVLECIGGGDLAVAKRFVTGAADLLRYGGHAYFYFMGPDDYRKDSSWGFMATKKMN